MVSNDSLIKFQYVFCLIFEKAKLDHYLVMNLFKRIFKSRVFQEGLINRSLVSLREVLCSTIKTESILIKGSICRRLLSRQIWVDDVIVADILCAPLSQVGGGGCLWWGRATMKGRNPELESPVSPCIVFLVRSALWTWHATCLRDSLLWSRREWSPIGNHASTEIQPNLLLLSILLHIINSTSFPY